MLVLVSIKKFMLLSKAKKASFIGAWDLDVVFSNYRVHLGIVIYTRIPVSFFFSNYGSMLII